MCMENSDEGCLLQAQQAELKGEVANIKERLTKVETEVASIRSETQDGFKQAAQTMRAINTAVADLAHNFGDRMNNLDKRIVAEKEKWGDCLRDVLKWTVRVILAGCAVAMGITAWKNIM